ncbi:uncharacterized protein LOC143027412 [Oratosquilla oratoria]|uniref:uncharacterized protein LOC143027412 n=1 Tax=Oratosquilla oratoria TaxID=337810 RepID=UPI003F75FF57
MQKFSQSLNFDRSPRTRPWIQVPHTYLTVQDWGKSVELTIWIENPWVPVRVSAHFDHWLLLDHYLTHRLRTMKLPADVTWEPLRPKMLGLETENMRAFIKERRPSTLTEAIRLANDWTSAHPTLPRTSVPNTKKFSRPPKPPKVTTVPPNSFSGRKDPPPLTCHGCGEIGHIRSRCPRNPRTFKEGTSATQPYKVGFCLSDRRVPHFQASGTINGAWVSTIIRDTGCSCVVVSDEILPDIDVPSCKKVYVTDYLGRVDSFPLVSCYLRCPYYEGWTDVVRAPIKVASVLIGNIPGVKDPNISECSPPADDSAIPRPTQTASPSPKHLVCAVQTRAGKMKRIHPLALPALQPLSVTPDKFGLLQSSCEKLSAARAKADSGEIDQMENGSTYQFVKMDGLLYRKCLTSNRPDKVGKSTLVIPRDCRPIILSIVHERPLAGHFSHRKTELKVAEQFYWPGMGTDIRTFCRSCDKCQRFSAKGRVPPVPLQPMPIVTEPFARVAIDLVGPLSPASSDGHRYILTLIDFATEFPEAVPLKDIDSISVTEALLTIFSGVGIPREILLDRGTQFTSTLMKELHRMLGVKPIFTTPFHPSGNGRIERLHGALKAILRTLCDEKPRELHRYLIPTLFALRELPCDRTGFSAFELLYGRSVRGPLSVFRDLWENRTLHEEERSSFQYVIELQEKLSECSQMAARQADISSSRYKAYFDLKLQNRQFKPGDEVLVLMPSDTSKLLVTWNGPYKVLERHRFYHANILKRYHRRAQVQQLELMDEISAIEELSAPGNEKVSVIDEGDPCDLSQLPLTPDGITRSPSTDKPEVGQLNPDQLSQLQNLMGEYKDVFSDEPGCTSTLTHDIQLTTTDRVQAKVYPVPIHLRPVFKKEVETLFWQGILQRSFSPHSSPVVMVRKTDGSYRMAIDYRQLNSVTVFDAKPTCSMEEDLYKFSGARYISELKLCKAYYQVPLSDKAKALTSFSSHLGLMEFCRMPFDLVTAGATYIRLIRLVLADLPNVCFYFNNIFIFSKSWDEHLEAPRRVFERLWDHHLTVKPSKCRFGVSSIQYLGFILDGTSLRPHHDKIEAITRMPPPTSKKLLRTFLSLISFYKLFIPQASDYTGPLSDLLRKTSPEPLPWTEDLLDRFCHLKVATSSQPVLRLPDPNVTFILRTDTSLYGLGAVLLQYQNECPRPVAYASRKLLDREMRYSTIDRECLAVVFSISRFDYYLRGKEFVLEVDHKPLLYLATFKGKNDHLLRWALALQAYKFRVVHIAEKDNLVYSCPGGGIRAHPRSPGYNSIHHGSIDSRLAPHLGESACLRANSTNESVSSFEAREDYACAERPRLQFLGLLDVKSSRHCCSQKENRIPSGPERFVPTHPEHCYSVVTIRRFKVLSTLCQVFLSSAFHCAPFDGPREPSSSFALTEILGSFRELAPIVQLSHQQVEDHEALCGYHLETIQAKDVEVEAHETSYGYHLNSGRPVTKAQLSPAFGSTARQRSRAACGQRAVRSVRGW